MKNDPFQIVLADDDEGDRFLLKEAFSEIKIKTVIHTVNDGTELMEYLHQKDLSIPYLIFLDLNMPLKNGLECLKEMKNEEKLKDIFIAIYSTSDHENDVDETFKNGANIYITKPNDFSKLKQVLEKAVTTASQYRDSIMKRENFLLKI